MTIVKVSDCTTGTPSQTNESNIDNTLKSILDQLKAQNAQIKQMQARIADLEAKEQRSFEVLRGCASDLDLFYPLHGFSSRESKLYPESEGTSSKK